mgnify:CR=1 FL=1
MYIAIDNSHLTDIANAIRSKNGSTDTYKPREMAEAIATIPTGGEGFSVLIRRPKKVSIGFSFSTETEVTT